MQFDDTLFKKSVRLYSIADLNEESLTTLNNTKPSALRLQVPHNGQLLTIELYQVDITTSDFKIQTDKGYIDTSRKGLFYRGIIVGDNTSLVVFSFFDVHFTGLVSSQSHGDINIGRLTSPGNRSRYIVYSERDLVDDHSTKCGTQSVSKIPTPSQRLAQSMSIPMTNKCVRIYYELTHASYVDQNSDIAQTMDWITAIHNSVSAAFANDGVTNFPISEVFIWTTPEPFIDGSCCNTLASFAGYRKSFNGDLAAHIQGGLGENGWAMGLDMVCRSYHGGPYSGAGPYMLSGTANNIEQFPVFSPTIKTITHEFGHLLGSPHTHQCVWNGNDTQIDDCGNPEGTNDCYDPDNPIIPILGEGTIMSYCGGALAAGFGPQPSQLIINTIENASCFGTDCIVSCSPSIQKLDITEVTDTQAKLTIVDDNPAASSWKFRMVPGAFITITENPFIITGLTPKTVFQIEVEQVCDVPFSGTFIYRALLHTSGKYCGEQVVDYNSTTYPDIYSYETSLYPTNIDEKVKLSFYYVETVAGTEFLNIYNGPSTTDPLLASFTGQNPAPAPVISTHPSGILTLKYITDEVNTVSLGYYADVICVPASLSLHENSLINVSFSPNPVQENLHFQSDQELLRIELFDMLGRNVGSHQI
ncbi:MAG TPA: M12 family metallo-peptidase, partial [Flavobacterium sp.]